MAGLGWHASRLLVATAVMALGHSAMAGEPARATPQVEEPRKPAASGAPKPAGPKEGATEAPNVVSTEESAEGVKTYEFGAVEVESRLRSPQIIYFLRRVRAQFEAEGLGHRSFMRELSDTRRHPVFK
jgi:hypothetical protein